MKNCLSILLIFFSLASYSSQSNSAALLLSKDSIARSHRYIYDNWKFNEGDDSAFALPAYDDSQWKETKPRLNLSTPEVPAFKGIGWFRLHLIADSTVTGRPLAMTMTHFGASEIYLDGKLIKSYGHINGPDSTEYYDPQELPFIFMVSNPGEHLMAIRYANYNAEKNYKVYRQPMAGFKMTIGETDDQLYQKDVRTAAAGLVLMLLSGIFLALSLLHLFMYLYYRGVRSNLYFSMLMFSLASVFTIFFIYYANHSPSFELKSFYLLNPFFTVACLALSGFINELFDKKKLRFKIIVAFGIVTLIVRFLGLESASALTIALVIGVSFEALFTVIFAIKKRVKGARIIGTGILFSTLFILSVFAAAFLQGGDIDLNDSTTGGQILIICLGLAILSIPFSMSVYLAWNFSSVNKNLALQLEQVKILSQKALEAEQEKQRILESRKEELESEVLKRTAELRDEKKKSDDLLLNILPAEVAEELKAKGTADAKQFDDVTVMFTDFKGFTQISEKLSPAELVAEIHSCFKAFDNIISKHGIEKIKTMGDAYMCAGGLPVANNTHAIDVVSAALEIVSFMNARNEAIVNGSPGAPRLRFEMRIGIHTGPVVAGIVGIKKFAYDIWGDTVNIASRMESSGEARKVNISGSTYELVKETFNCIHRGKIQAKNKGEIDMYFVDEKRKV